MEIERNQCKKASVKVMNKANTLVKGLDEKDISVGHRLPSKTAALKPMIVSLNRCISKVQMITKRKMLQKGVSNIQITRWTELAANRISKKKMKSDEHITSNGPTMWQYSLS